MSETISLDLVNLNNRLLSGAIELSHGQKFSITGTGFGTKVGYSDHFNLSGVLSQAVGTNFDTVGRWNGGSFIGAGNRFSVASSGMNGKCLYAHRVANGTPNNTVLWTGDDYLPMGQKWFTSCWVKHSTDGIQGGQWKYGRWQRVGNSLSDKPFEAYWNATNREPTQDHKVQFRDSAGTGGSNWTGFAGSSIARMPHGKNLWTRMDILFTMPTAYNNPTSFKCEGWVHDMNGVLAPLYCDFTDNQATELINPFDQSGSEWKYHLYQNYFGQAGGEGDYTASNHDLWMDKMFESYGDSKRVEFSSSPIYNPSNLPIKSFVQPLNYSDYPTPWTNTAIHSIFDAGTNLYGWLHVVDGMTSTKAIPVRVV